MEGTSFARLACLIHRQIRTNSAAWHSLLETMGAASNTGVLMS